MNIDIDKIKINPFTWVFVLLLIITRYYVELVNIVLTVAIHEFSHFIMAKRLNVNVLQIEIFPFGGAAILDSSLFIRPDLEILIALAGPLSNLVFVLLLIIIAESTGISFDHLISINIIMCIFNLLPGVPLDGGRALKSILSRFIGTIKANNTAVYISYILSLALMYYGIFTLIYGYKNYELIILAIFLFIAAKKERKLSVFFHLRDVAYKKADFYKRGCMSVRQIAVLENQKISKIINCFLPLKYHIIVVLDKNLREKYRLTETELFDYAVSNGINLCVGDVLNKIK
ncbi:M50 family metallopeptidase [Thermoanaerobacterium sp. RBIITD]|uniref:M50 family metallopeptidase n=1 Tax=Thermoanaerobacterium sp. RBIITD TaxID=1550240 RepID=UPI000BB92E47|nr:M50 family metallopeptidase [Thermoanaerobacterium sp. RBIITD]SNX55154.1 stage IV sporulation protein FB [Thermoanaerobacterium sp. RBIITD]